VGDQTHAMNVSIREARGGKTGVWEKKGGRTHVGTGGKCKNFQLE